ncbi:MAG: outer membrane beta-barrel family protein [Ginsengibacter sp.]
MIKSLFFFGILFLPLFLTAQISSIKGVVSDSSINQKTAKASVAVLNKRDSVLVNYTRTAPDGSFKIDNIPDGDYILLITYPKYGDYVDPFTIKSQDNIDMKQIYLTPKAKLLDEIVIRQAAIRLKGDTTEYAADSFKVRENANVEELLQNLPGISVDKDGKITAQGKQVQKVLVDGDEFFSDDPTIATKNLRADAIDKVQVFDKKSDQAVFSGIDDGQVTKTINLKLKDNAKNGYFGKVSVAGLDKYYNGTAFINAFKAKRKFSAFAIASSTDQTGLNFGDANSLGFGGGGMMVQGGGKTVVFGGSNDNSSGGLGAGNSGGQGLPESVKAGALFSNKWKDDKYNAGGNYLFNKLALRSADNTYSQNTLLDSVYYTRNATTTYSDKIQHSLDGRMEIQLDSSSSLKITAGGFAGTNNSNSNNTSQALSQENQVVNSSVRNNSSTGNNTSFNTNAIYRKKFKKVGRTVSINFNQRFNQSNSDGFLFNESKFFDQDGNLIRTQNTNQNKVNDNLSNTIRTRISYTEPLSKKSFIELNYSFDNSNSTQKILSYNKDGSGKYTDLVDSLSSDYKYIYNTNSAGVNYRFNEKKYNLSFGGNISNTAFEQVDHFKDVSRKRNYYNLFPQGSFNYKINSFSAIQLSYNGSTTQPTIDQIQPLINNDDPLNIVIGNPALKQQFSNQINLNFQSFQMLNERFAFLGMNFSTVKDQISSSYIIDSLGKRTTQYINVDGNYNVGIFGVFSTKIPKTSFKINFSPNAFLNQNTNFVNGVRNISKNLTFSPDIGFSKRKNNVYDIRVNFSPSYTNSTSSISKAATTKYWTYNISANGNYTFPGKIELGSNIDFQFRDKINASDLNNNVIFWNAYVEKKFLKKDQLTLRASVNDILDQNKGYSRTVQTDAIVERNYLTFQRYGLLTLTYNFNTSGAKPSSGQRFNF